jgi:rhodanese-related sulfurtransferase
MSNQRISYILSAVLAWFTVACGPPSHFDRSAQELLSSISDAENVVTLQDAETAIQQKKTDFVLVDLRSPIEFERGHLEGAVSIPAQHLLESKSLDVFDNKKAVIVLYGRHQEQAHGPWLLLRQLGYDHVKLLQAGYDGVVAADSLSFLAPETALFDYSASFRQATAEGQKAIEAVKIVPAATTIAPKTITTKPKAAAKPAAEEEEGC